MKPLHCKLCNGKEFKTTSDLRKHQWSEHRDLYKNIGGGKGWSKEQHAKFKNTLALKKALQVGNGNLSGQDLLERLKEQQRFINDAVALVEGLLEK